MGECNVNPESEVPAAVADRLNSICASSGFRRSPRLQRFLRYVVCHSTIRPNEQLKELQIAVDVFDRRRDFEPQIDPIVRVEAGRLRLRMTEYYAGPGQNDEVLIEIGKGGYFATFRNNPGRPSPPSANNGSVASASAYRSYLKGRYFWDKRTPNCLTKALEYFERASALDPAFSLARMGIADCSLVTATFEFAAPAVAVAKARQTAESVLRQGNLLAEAHTTLAAIHAFCDQEWLAAEKEFRRAIEIDPNYATAWQWYGMCCSALGRWDEGLSLLRTATECDPLSLMANTQLACGLYLAKRYAEASEVSALALEMDPNCWPARYFSGLIYEQQNLFAKAVRELQQARELSEGNALTVAALTHVYARAGSELDARKILLQLQGESSVYVSQWALALAYAGLGETEQALRALAQSIAAPSPQPAIFMSSEPRLDCLRSEPRFRQMENRLYGRALTR